MATRKLTLFELHVDDVHFSPFSAGSEQAEAVTDSDDSIADPHDSERPTRAFLPLIGLAGLAVGAGAIVYRRLAAAEAETEADVEADVEVAFDADDEAAEIST